MPAETLAANGRQFPAITIRYNVADDVADGTVITNSATVDARTFDPNPANNTGRPAPPSAPKPTSPSAKTLTSPQMVAGEPATYAVDVINLGPSVERGPFTITDTLPPSSTFVSAVGPGWECLPDRPGPSARPSRAPTRPTWPWVT